MDENKLDDILYKACKESRESLMPFGPDFDRIEREAIIHLKKRHATHRRRVWVRTAVAVAAAFLFINGFFLFAEFEPVKAYRAEVKKLVFNLVSNNTTGAFEAEIVRTSNEIAKAQKTVPFQIPVPGWIPEGYKFDDVRVVSSGNDDYQVTIQYSAQNEKISISIGNDSSISGTDAAKIEGTEGTFETMRVGIIDVYYAFINKDKGQRVQSYYINSQGLNVHISGNMDKQSLQKFIEEMK